MLRFWPLADGELRWVFGEMPNEAPVMDVLKKTDETLRRLVDHFGMSWIESERATTNCGLRIAGFSETDEGPVTHGWLLGYVDPPIVNSVEYGLEVELCKTMDNRAWEAAARVSVYESTGQFTVDSFPDSEPRYHSPLEASHGLLEAAEWLLDRARSPSWPPDPDGDE